MTTDRPGGRVGSRAGRRRIVILTEDSKPALGGIAEYLHQLAVATSAGHDVLVVTSVPGAEALNAELPFRYREVGWFRQQQARRGDGFMPTRRINTLAWHLGRRHRVRELLARIHSEQPNSSYILGRMSPVTYPWYVACLDLGLEYSAIGYGLELIEALTPVWAQRRAAMVDAARHWFVISHDTSAKLTQFGVPESRQSLLLPGVVMPDPAAPTERAQRAIRERLALGGAPFVLSLCHLRHRKGIDLAIEAFAHVASEFPTLRYVAAGAGPEREVLSAVARDSGVGDRVIFPGAIDEATKAALFAECAFFVLPTRAEAHDVEGFGIVYLEAGSYGKAVIGGANGGVAEAIAHEETGLLVDTRDAGELTAAMRQLLRDPACSNEMGRRGAERACRDFMWEDRGRAFARRVDDLAEERRRETPAGMPSAVGRVRRHMGSASNRAFSAVEVLAVLARRGRLGTFLGRGIALTDREACAHATMAWVQRAIHAGGGDGASARYHVTNGWAGAYPEITGYLISTLLHYATAWRDTELADSAVHAGEWLARTRLPSGAICRKQWYPGNSTPSVFNTAQVIEGWCALARAPTTGPAAAAEWTELARESGDWLLTEQDPSGIWIRNAFNGIPHAYYARVAAPLARLAALTGDERYAAAARRALDWVLSQQQSSGWFRSAGFTAAEAPTTHTIAYVLEGLLQGGGLLAEPRYTAAADRAGRALLHVYELLGRLPGRFSVDWRGRARWRCLTGEAQIAIAWCLLARSTGEKRYRRAAEAVAASLQRRVRIAPAWPEISGAMPGSSPPWGEYDPFGYPTHAAKFTLDLFALLSA